VLRSLVSEDNARLERERATRSTRLATRLANLQNSASYVNGDREPQDSGLPRVMLTDSYGSVTSLSRSGDGTTRFASEVNSSWRINDEYSRRLTGDDDPDDNEFTGRVNDDDNSLSTVNALQLRPGRFGGISRRYGNKEYGRGPSILLTGDAGRAEYLTTNSDADDVQTRDERGFSGGELGSHDNNDGYRRNLSRHDDDDNPLSVANVQLRPGRFGGISQMSRHRNVFGRGPSTLLSGRHGRLSSYIAADEVETTVRGGRAVDDGDAIASRRGGWSVLAALTNWRRRRQAPRGDHVEMQPQGQQ